MYLRKYCRDATVYIPRRNKNLYIYYIFIDSDIILHGITD